MVRDANHLFVGGDLFVAPEPRRMTRGTCRAGLCAQSTASAGSLDPAELRKEMGT